MLQIPASLYLARYILFKVLALTVSHMSPVFTGIIQKSTEIQKYQSFLRERMTKNNLCSSFVKAHREGLLFLSWHWCVPLLFSELWCILGTVVQSNAACIVLLHLSHCAASSGASKRLWCLRPPLSRMQICKLTWARRLHELTACQPPPHDVSSVQLREKSLELRFICQANSRQCLWFKVGAHKETEDARLGSV